MAEDQASDPAKAFEDLRAEVSVLRKAVESLPAAIRDNRPPDYAQDLAVIGKGLDEIGSQLETIQQSPALRLSPEQQGASIATAGSAMIREAAQKLDRAAQEADRERYNLSQMIGTLATKEGRKLFWAIMLPSIFLLGFMAFPIVMRAMPLGLKSEMAAAIMSASEWDAGTALMKAGNPDGWAQLTADADLVSANRDKITDCRTVATKAKKEQRCIITVPVS
jgi:Spy/CpxP family protein refolding chaperone